MIKTLWALAIVFLSATACFSQAAETSDVSPIRLGLILDMSSVYADVTGAGSVMAGGGWRQPLVITALQREASITDTSLVTWLAVYSVWVLRLRATDSGSSPV